MANYFLLMLTSICFSRIKNMDESFNIGTVPMPGAPFMEYCNAALIIPGPHCTSVRQGLVRTIKDVEAEVEILTFGVHRIDRTNLIFPIAFPCACGESPCKFIFDDQYLTKEYRFCAWCGNTQPKMLKCSGCNEAKYW
jgi:hypothetical protein